MTNMYLEDRLLLEKCAEMDLECPIELEYYLVESEIDTSDEQAGKTIYGIGIIKKNEKGMQRRQAGWPISPAVSPGPKRCLRSL